MYDAYEDDGDKKYNMSRSAMTSSDITNNDENINGGNFFVGMTMVALQSNIDDEINMYTYTLYKIYIIICDVI